MVHLESKNVWDGEVTKIVKLKGRLVIHLIHFLESWIFWSAGGISHFFFVWVRNSTRVSGQAKTKRLQVAKVEERRK